MFKSRINIFTGHFGSGKTEVSINYALKMSAAAGKTAIVDFDIVNPYFRTADAKLFLERKGIYVVTPVYANTNVDVPALPPEVNALLGKKDYRIVLDVGGDDMGARVLSGYRDAILQSYYDMFFVINVKRPMTDTLEKILRMVDDIEGTSRLKVTKLVNNTNLLEFTTVDDIVEGYDIIEKVSHKLNIPCGFVSCMEEHYATVSNRLNADVLSMTKHLKLPWEN